MVFNGRPLEESDLLSAAGVEEEATLNVLGRLLGGAKKRKKKTYTKPKKQKHKHKKIKLRVLKFYKVRARGGGRAAGAQEPACQRHASAGSTGCSGGSGNGFAYGFDAVAEASARGAAAARRARPAARHQRTIARHVSQRLACTPAASPRHPQQPHSEA